ncbi:MAG: helix-turn-helix domain-containing protein [Leptolyngbya sp. SIOISBB]|nr:helix-turn-helix domain-containing protein [Leptolyngbya sp. SIOISBB]
MKQNSNISKLWFQPAKLLPTRSNTPIYGPGWTDEKAVQAFRCHRNTVANLRQRLVEQGLEAALQRQPQKTPSRQPVCNGEAEAQVIALRCGEPPDGDARWTLRLLADKAVEQEIVPAVGHETVRQVLKKRIKTTSVPPVRDSASAKR